MKKYYDFSKGRRGAVIPSQPGKTRITIRIDDDVLDWFREQVNAAGGGNYQTMMNQALRNFMEGRSDAGEAGFEEMLRRVLSEVLSASVKPRSIPRKSTRRKGARRPTS